MTGQRTGRGMNKYETGGKHPDKKPVLHGGKDSFIVKPSFKRFLYNRKSDFPFPVSHLFPKNIRRVVCW